MALPNSPVYKNKMRGVVYLLNFIFSLQLATVSYFAANYLKFLGIDAKNISFVYMLTSILSVLAFLISSRIFNRIGAYKTIFISAVLYILFYVVQAFNFNFYASLIAFVLNATLAAFIVAGLDALMERFTESDEETGSQRGIFITMASAAFVAGPFIGGLLVKGNDFKSLWLAAAALLAPFIILSFWKLKSIERIKYKQFHIKHTIQAILKDKNIFNIFFAQFILYFFYSIMVIYTSLYLKEVAKLPFDKIGLIFAIMLLPFVFITVPLGRIADKVLGEQEMLIAGFAIMAISTFLFAINENYSWIVLALLLFGTRVGAATVQTMTETYFFKLVDGKDADLISAFRSMYPISSVIAPLLAAPILYFAGYKELYIMLALVSFFGIYFAFKIEDTK